MTSATHRAHGARILAALILLAAAAGCSKQSTAPGASAVGAGTTAGKSAPGFTPATQDPVASGSTNGSSGMGNLLPLTPTITTYLMRRDALKKDGNVISDGKTGEKLLQIDDAGPETGLAPPTSSGQLVPSHLGSLDGYEYLPNSQGGPAPNYWVVCEAKGSCSKLTPLSSTNPKVSAIIGTLQRQAAKKP